MAESRKTEPAPEPSGNVVIRQPNPNQGQGSTRAISQRTAWQYEHDETDIQIQVIEDKILSIREEGNVVQGAPGNQRGATFSWTSDTDDGEGNVRLATSYMQAGTDDWVSEWWIIAPDGSIVEEGID